MEPFFVLAGIAAAHGAISHIGFDADDRFDPPGFAGAVKLDNPVHSPVVGEGDGGLVQRFGTGDQIINTAEAVEQGVFAVDVQVDEGLVFAHGRRREG